MTEPTALDGSEKANPGSSDLFVYHYIDHVGTIEVPRTWLDRDDPLRLGVGDAHEGIALYGGECAAIFRNRPCKDVSVVALLVELDDNVSLCGRHFAVHASGRPLALTDR